MLNRRNFIKYSGSGVLLASLNNGFPYGMLRRDAIIGHNSHQYKIDMKWGELNHQKVPVKDCHEMVKDTQGRIILLTNHTRNNIIIYNKSGRLIDTWGSEYPGAHGLTLVDEGGEDFLYITDYERHEVIKTTLDGRTVMVMECPLESEQYTSKAQYLPTETAVAPNGDIYVTDGYGLQYILHYNAKGDLLNIFGGNGDKEHHFQNAHGIAIDQREASEPTLLITERQQNKLKRFTMDGTYISSIILPGAYICRPVIHKKNVFLATIWSGDGSPGTGFITVLDENNRLVSAPGGCQPVYEKGVLKPMYQALKVFIHPHDVCIDEDENMYVAQWNAGNIYPIKLYRV
jgi:hypothetical protein